MNTKNKSSKTATTAVSLGPLWKEPLLQAHICKQVLCKDRTHQVAEVARGLLSVMFDCMANMLRDEITASHQQGNGYK